MTKGGLSIFCPKCQAFSVCAAISPHKLGLPKARRWKKINHLDIKWFRRARECRVCKHRFTTAEINEELLNEIVELRERLAERNANMSQELLELQERLAERNKDRTYALTELGKCGDSRLVLSPLKAVVREPSKPSTAKCTCALYTLFLLAEPNYVSCVRLSEVMADLSHDSVNRFLLREQYTPRDLFDEVKAHLNLVGGIASGDDSVVDKPYSDPQKTDLMGYFWSGKHKRTVKGINLITLYYTDIAGTSYPVNFRLYDKREGKTKNDYFREMGSEVKAWGLKLAWVTGDCWYASVENLKFLRNEEVGFLFGIANNRQVSVERGTQVQVQTLTIPDSGWVVYLKEFGWVKVFCQNFKNEVRYYILFLPDPDPLRQLGRSDFLHVHDRHWQIESFHRVIKQVCNIERFQVRTESAIKTHFFCALQAFCKLQTMRVEGLIDNLYQISRQLFIPVIRQFIQENLPKSV